MARTRYQRRILTPGTEVDMSLCSGSKSRAIYKSAEDYCAQQPGDHEKPEETRHVAKVLLPGTVPAYNDTLAFPSNRPALAAARTDANGKLPVGRSVKHRNLWKK